MYNWFSKKVPAQHAHETKPSLKVKVFTTLSDIKSLHGQWVVDLYNHMREEMNTIINGFKFMFLKPFNLHKRQ